MNFFYEGDGGVENCRRFLSRPGEDVLNNNKPGYDASLVEAVGLEF